MFRTVGEGSELNPARRSDRRRNRKSVGKIFDTYVAIPADDPTPRVQPVKKNRMVRLRIDVILLLTVVTIVIFGLVMVFSASYDFSYFDKGDYTEIFIRQLLWLAIGTAAAVTFTFIDYHVLRRFAVPAIGFTILLLISVLILNEVRLGAARTIYEGSIQPSELAKLVTIIYLSIWLYARRDQISDVSFGLIPLAAILGILGGLILLQPDLSAVMTVLFLGGLMFFLAGGEMRQIGVLLIIAVIIVYGVFLIYPTGSERIQYYLAGIKDPTDASYHVKRSYEAFVKGGWFGVGIGKGETKLTGLPFPHTDSVFAVVGEETGILGASLMVGLFAVFLWRGMTVSKRAPDELGSLLAAGLTLWIATEAFINMAVMVNLLPFAGNALPFVSAGGSSLVVTMAAVGILLNISRLTERSQNEDGKLFNAVVNLRGRNRRRSISSARRPPGINRRRPRQQG